MTLATCRTTASTHAAMMHQDLDMVSLAGHRLSQLLQCLEAAGCFATWLLGLHRLTPAAAKVVSGHATRTQCCSNSHLSALRLMLLLLLQLTILFTRTTRYQNAIDAPLKTKMKIRGLAEIALQHQRTVLSCGLQKPMLI